MSFRHVSVALVALITACAPETPADAPRASHRSTTQALDSTGLPGWSVGRRYLVDHTAPGAVSLTEFQVRLTLDTAAEIAAGRMKSDCSDLRVYDGSGCAPTNAVSFWVADGTCNTATTHVWLKLPSIPAQSLTPLAFFWGNPAATSVSDGPATFPVFFDDFNGPSFDTDKWFTHGGLTQAGGVVSNVPGASAFWSKAEVMEAGKTVFGVRTDAQSAGGADIEYGAGSLLNAVAPGNIHFSSRTWSGVTWMSYDDKFALIGANPAAGSCVAQQLPGRWANAPGDLTFFQSEFFYELNADGSTTFGIYDKFGQKLETTQGGPGCSVAPRERAYWQYDHDSNLPNPVSRVDYAYVRSYAKPDPVVVNTGIVIAPETCLAEGEGPCTTANQGEVCQTARCGAASNVCVPNRTDACAIDADCAAGQRCVSAEYVCETPAAISSSGAAQDLVSGTPWSFTLTATGTAPLTLGATGLPAWASFDPGSGLLSGTPTADGEFTLSLSASNRTGSASQSLSLTVRTAPTITNELLAWAELGRFFSASLTASGTAPISFTATGLPAGLGLSGTTLSGMPTEAGRFEVHQTAQNAAGADVKTFVLQVRDVIPAPSIVSPVAGASLGQAQLLITGTAPAGEAGHLVRVRDDMLVVCEASIGPDLTWSCAATLSEGPHQLAARVVSAGDLEGAAADLRAFSIDLTAPALPSWAAPAERAELSTDAPRFSGLGEPGAQVFVRVVGQPLCTATVAPDGEWLCTSAVALGQGEHVLEATQRDAAGNVSPAALRTVRIDTLAPMAPTLDAPAQDEVLGSARPVFSGTAEPEAVVLVRVRGDEQCRTTADAQGAWSCQGASLEEGPQNADVQSHDAAGNVSELTLRAFVIDTIAPAVPTLATPRAGEVLGSPRPSFSGLAEAGSTVVVRVNGAEYCSVTADAQGAWSCAGLDLADGPHDVTVESRDAARNVSSLPVSAFAIDTQLPPEPGLIGPVADERLNAAQPTFVGVAEAGSVVVVWVDGDEHCRVTADAQGGWSCSGPGLSDGAHHVSVSSRDAAGNTSTLAPRAFSIDTVSPQVPTLLGPAQSPPQPRAEPLFSGTAEPGSELVVLVNGLIHCRATADQQGAWQCTGDALADGAHEVTVASVDLAGNVSTMPTQPFSIDTQAPRQPTLVSPREGASVATARPVFSGFAEPWSAVLVTVSGSELCRATAQEDGAWGCSGDALDEGQHVGVVKSTDAAGHESLATERVFWVDTVAPAAPVILAPTGRVFEATPTVLGTAERGAALLVTLDGRELCRPTADADGRWSCAISSALSPGFHELAAGAVDAAGNASHGMSHRFDVQTASGTMVDPPKMVQGEGMRISGKATPGATVNVYVNGELVGSTTAGPDGSWSYELPALGAGTHEVSFGVTGSDGSEVYRSPVQKVEVAATVPAIEPAEAPVPASGCSGCSGIPVADLGVFAFLALALLGRRARR